MKAVGITAEEVARTATTKARERGGFEDGAWLTIASGLNLA